MDHSEFFSYLLRSTDSDTDKLPALKDLSLEMGISISTLREQLEVAKALGLVDVKPDVEFAICHILSLLL